MALFTRLYRDARSTKHEKGGQRIWDVKLFIYLHPVSSLRMTGVILLLPLYAFVACREKNFYATKDTGASVLTTSNQARTQTHVFRRRADTEESHVFAASMCPPDDRNAHHML